MSKLVWCWVALVVHAAGLCAQVNPPQWATEGPYVEERSFSIALPLETLATKLLVTIEVGGAPRRFVFDTGSPSMMSTALATELGLRVIDTQKGRDSHGTIVESGIVQADLTLDGVTLRKVPLFVADFSTSTAASCFLGDGVLGSEVLPLCAWQIDRPNSVLRCHSVLDTLDHVEGATKLRLYDFGYPHAPIFDARFAKKAKSKVMFDTGSPTYFAISPPDFEGAKRAGGVGTVTVGHGSLGESLGGRAPMMDQLRGELKTLSVGSVRLGGVEAIVRESAPSLLGASLLEHFIITLDPRSESAYFQEYREGPFVRPSLGFTLAFGPEISVALVWDGSPAARAGLKAGQRLIAINGVTAAASCEGIRRVLEAMSGESIALAWDGGAATISRGDAHIVP